MTPMPFDVELQLRRHGAALRALAGEMVRDPWVADDAVQEVWLGALRRPPAHQAAFGGWLATALRNALRGLGRRERRNLRRERFAAEARPDVVEDHTAKLVREEQAQRLLAAVMALAKPFREAIWQRYFEGRTPREIAASNGVPCATVKSRLQRGLQQLRVKLGEDGAPGWRAALAVAFGWGTAPLSGVLLMSLWTKCVAAVVVLATSGVWWWSQRDPAAAPSGAGASGADVAAAAPASGEPDRPEPGTPERTPVATGAAPAAAASIEVRVRTAAGEAVAGATVWFVKPGFAYGELPLAQADLYSRSTESYLREFGLARIADANGDARLPITAAPGLVIARKGNLYGVGSARGGRILEIVVAAHHTLMVETVDPSGTPVPHVPVIGQPVPANGLVNPLAQWTLGTTNDHGILTQVLEVRAEDDPIERIRLHAELLDGAHGQQTIDARSPPAFVRLTLPQTGTVRARIQQVDGAALPQRVLDALHAELSVVDGQRTTSARWGLQHRPELRYVALDAEGNATFENIPLGRILQIRFPGMVVSAKEFPGPTGSERDVRIVRTIESGHPFLVGRLVDPDGRAIGDANVTVVCPSNPELLLSVAAKTDALGWFLVWLTDRCTGRRDVVLSLGMDWGSTGPARQVAVTVAGPLLGRVDVGSVVMPLAK